MSQEGTDHPVLDKAGFSVWCSDGVSLTFSRVNALAECVTLQNAAEHSDGFVVPFDAECMQRVRSLLEQLSAQEDVFDGGKSCAAGLELAEAFDLIEAALFLEAARLLHVLQEAVAVALKAQPTADSLRIALGAVADLSPAEDAAAASAPLLAAPAPTLRAQLALPGRLRTADAAEACLGGCDALTLRRLLGVSKDWAERARLVAGSAESRRVEQTCLAVVAPACKADRRSV